MKILYKQPDQGSNNGLGRFGVGGCFLKEIRFESDDTHTTKKVHYHTGFELHMITAGMQTYEVAGRTYKLESGSFLLICPNVPHKILTVAPNTQKYSITFDKQHEHLEPCVFGEVTPRILSDLAYIKSEALLKKEFSAILAENSILEILIHVFRLLGIEEKEEPQTQNDNAVIALAKQYMEDNAELNLSVTDVAGYCYLSAKQLTRIFREFEGVTPGEYIAQCRTRRIEELLKKESMSLKGISEIMHFNNEYYFNAFFKKHAGMSPGAYRKMFGK